MLSFRRNSNRRDSKVTRRTSLSYYRSGQAPAKSPFKRNRQSAKRGSLSKILDWLIIIIILGGIIYSLMLRPQPSIALNSTDYHSANEYRDAAQAVLKNLKNRNKLTFDENGLAADLKRKFPEINDVTANLPLFGQAPTIHIGVAEPSLILRGAEGTFGAAERFVVDSKGTIVGPLAEFPSIKNLPLITDETGFEAREGRSLLSLSDVGFILTLIAQANKSKVPIASLTLPKFAQEVDLRTADRSYLVKFYLGGDALIQSGQFLAARQNFDQTNKQPQQYLDVRVSGKIYYK